METILIAIIVAVAPTIAAVGAIVVGIRNGRQADAAKEAALRAATAAEQGQAEIIATKDGVFYVGDKLDGRLQSLLELTAANAMALGRAQGIAAEQERVAAGAASVLPAAETTPIVPVPPKAEGGPS